MDGERDTMASAPVPSFELKLVRSGRTLHVPADRTALEIMREAGIDAAYSCESGVCGTCLMAVMDGVPDHRDSFLTDAEHHAGDCFTPCCSRALTPTLSVDA